jgi:hypothetical protein
VRRDCGDDQERGQNQELETQQAGYDFPRLGTAGILQQILGQDRNECSGQGSLCKQFPQRVRDIEYQIDNIGFGADAKQGCENTDAHEAQQAGPESGEHDDGR